jgi:enoyl-CoA hydratase
MEFKTLLFEVTDGIAMVTINRPDKLNALNSDVIADLGEAFARIVENPEIRVVILTGAGDKAFVAGADISQMPEFNSLMGEHFAAQGQAVLNTIENCPKPVIAAVNGFALGGGTEIAMACDFIYASDKAKFGQPEINLGIIPGFGGTQRLPRLVGNAMAMELVLTGDMIDAAEAHRIGLANKVFPADQLMDEVKKTAAKIASKGQVAVRLAKDCINNGTDVDLDRALLIERQAFSMLCSTEDKNEGTTAFLEKRKPAFKDR